MKYFKDNSLSIGNTPLIDLGNITNSKDTLVLGKIEGRNPAYSVKDRIGAAMIWDAEKKGILKKGMKIIEPTSGNTGIALAMIGASRGYKVILTMPETMTIERRKILTFLGAEVILTEGEKGMLGAIQRAESIIQNDPDKFYIPQQFNNPENPNIHEKTTGPEIWEALEGKIDVLIAGVGTGGTISGISRYIKNKCNKKIITVAVEPENSPVISQTLNNETIKPGPHMIQGIGAGFIPKNLDLSIIDRVEKVSNDEAFEYGKKLALNGGILAGISSGASVAVASRLAREEQYLGKTIVAILPDAGERYLSTILFE